jgi:hypothetical protein
VTLTTSRGAFDDFEFDSEKWLFLSHERSSDPSHTHRAPTEPLIRCRFDAR